MRIILGKTTLLNHILSQQHGKRLAVVENEFGAINLDSKLLGNITKINGVQLVELTNGCICCSVEVELLKALTALLEKNQNVPLDGIIIETTGSLSFQKQIYSKIGLADPSPVAQMFFNEDDIRKYARLDGIVCVVDTKHVLQQLDRREGCVNEVEEQIAFADVILLNKIDLVTCDHLEKVKQRIQQINKSAKLIPCSQSKVDVKELMNIDCFSLDKALELKQEFLQTNNHTHYNNSVQSFAIEEPGEIDHVRFNEFLSSLLDKNGDNMYRCKGILNIKGFERKYVFQSVHNWLQGEMGDYWKESEDKTNRLVFIGKNLNTEELKSEFLKCKI